MKQLLFTVVMLLAIGEIYGQEETNYHPIVQAALEESYFAKNVNWPTLDVEFKKRFGSGKNKDSIKTALTYLINTLGDKHASFRSSKDYRPVAYFTAYETLNETDTRPRDPEFFNTVINDIEARFSHKQLNPTTGYLKVVGIGPQVNLIEEAQRIREAISDLNDSGVSKWIIDLRFNGGGNMNPMIAGLAPLLSEGNIGGSVNAEGESFQTFQIENGRFYDTGRLVDSTAQKIRLRQTPKIAILLSRYTVSSGEIVATIFKGQENTRFFGEDSGGLTTVLGWNPVSPDMYMCIAAAIYADRDGTVYSERIPVDVKIPLDIENLPQEDAILQVALAWLKE